MGTLREGGVAAKKGKENWTVRERETVLETPWFTIVRNTCEVPGGTIVPSYYVQHDKDAVMVLVVDAKGRVLLEEQYRFPIDRISYDYPAGSVEPGDRSLVAAARRELEEETGLRARKLEKLFSMDKNPSSTASRMHVFLVREFGPGQKEDNPAERVRSRFYTPAEILRMVERGRLSCVFCLAATFYLARRFRWK